MLWGTNICSHLDCLSSIESKKLSMETFKAPDINEFLLDHLTLIIFI